MTCTIFYYSQPSNICLGTARGGQNHPQHGMQHFLQKLQRAWHSPRHCFLGGQTTKETAIINSHIDERLKILEWVMIIEDPKTNPKPLHSRIKWTKLTIVNEYSVSCHGITCPRQRKKRPNGMLAFISQVHRPDACRLENLVTSAKDKKSMTRYLGEYSIHS